MTKIYCLVSWRFKWLFVAIFLFSFESKAFVQDSARITIHVSDTPIEMVFRQIEKQTGYSFYYSKPTLSGNELISVNLNRATLPITLNTILKGKDVNWLLKDGGIILSKKTATKDLSADTIPRIDVNGLVVDPQGRPIAGATISLRGQSRGQTSNNNGEFSFRNIATNVTLVVSSIGYETKQYRLSGEQTVRIKLDTLVREIQTIDVVSTGYQIIAKERATGSFSQPDKEVYNARIATDIITKLEGSTSGLVFNRATNGNSSISIRGRSTILADANPLIIVDNFPYEGDIRNINPGDVDNITILKDAAAASIWGARSGNGVIVITTKRGKYNQPVSVNVIANFTANFKPDLYRSHSYLNSSDFIDLEKDLFNKGYYDADISNVLSPQPISPVVELLAKQKAGLISASEAENKINALRKVDSRSEILDNFYKIGLNQQYNVSLSGGSDRSRYFVSLGYDNNDGNQSGFKYNRYTINANNTFIPIKNLEISTDINYTQSVNEGNLALSNTATGGSASKALYPYAKFTDENGIPIPIVKDYRLGWVDTVGRGKLLDWHFNPILERDLSDNRTALTDNRINIGVRYSINKVLGVEVKYQYQKNNTENRVYTSPDAYFARDLVNKFTRINGASVVNNLPKGGILDKISSESEAHNLRGQLNLNKNWALHRLSAIVGLDVRQIEGVSNRVYNYGYKDDIGTFQTVRYDSSYSLFPSGSGKIMNNNSAIAGTTNRYRSYFANASYTYNNIYTISASGRIDQANIFGVKANQRATPLWSAGLKYNLSNEKFYNISWLTDLQFRFTYGFNANKFDGTTAFTTGAYVQEVPPLQPSYVLISALGNPQITWERIKVLNWGVDFALSKVLSGSIEYYQKYGIDLIGGEPIPSSTGYNGIVTNYGNMKGTGVDLSLNTLNIDKAVRWSTNFIFSFARDKVTKYVGQTNFNIGQPVQGIYSLAWGGLDPLTGDPLGYKDGQISKDYAVITSSVVNSRLYNGPANPTFFGGLRNSVSWKNLSLIANLSYKFGYYFRREALSYGNLLRSWRGHDDFLNRWKQKGDELKTNVPSFIYPLPSSSRDAFYADSEILVERGDHVRLQDVFLIYTLDKFSHRKLPFNNLQINFSVSNIGILWMSNKYNIDPDYQRVTSPGRSVSLGIKAGL